MKQTEYALSLSADPDALRVFIRPSRQNPGQYLKIGHNQPPTHLTNL